MRRPARGKFTTDLLWNAAAFVLSALLGVLVNLFIIRYYDAAALGVFNQVYALYIMLSQLAVGGVHLAVQAFVPKHADEPAQHHPMMSSALLLTLLSSVLIMALAWAGRHLPGQWFESHQVGVAFPLVIWGLLFFSFNKVLLAYHNGARRMKLFAVFQFMRFFLLFIMLMVLALQGAPPEHLPAILAWTELLLFAVLIPVTLRYYKPWEMRGMGGWLRQNFRFGNRALPGNFLLDVNTRVDVLMLGIFLNDRLVGLYSFAATVAEGVMYLPVLFRNNINPLLTRSWHRTGPALLQRLLVRNRKAFFRVLAPITLVTIPLFPLAMWVLGMNDEPMTVWALFAILVGGVAITSGYQPFQMLFGQLGRPGTQTIFVASVFTANVLLNALLIPVFGLYGAAIGTALSFVAMVVVLRWLAGRRFGVRF